MTVSTTDHTICYDTSGLTRVFPIPFMFLDPADIQITLRDAADEMQNASLGVYRIEGQQQEAGGSVTFQLAPAKGQRLIITRQISLLQDTAWKNHTVIDATILERNFDKLTMGLQQLAPSVARSIQLDRGATGNPPTLASPTGEGGKVLILDETGRQITYYNAAAITTAGLYHKETFSGDGARCDFTLLHPAASANSLQVVLERQMQEPGVDYILTGQAIRFTTPPKAGTRNLYVIHLADTQHAQTVADGSITGDKLAEGCLLPNPELRQFSQTVRPLAPVQGEAVMDLRLASVWTLTLTQDTKVTLRCPPGAGKNYGCKLLLTTAATPYHILWPAGTKWPYGQVPEFKGASETHLLLFETFDAGASWYGALVMEALR